MYQLLNHAMIYNDRPIEIRKTGSELKSFCQIPKE